jgi:hypothetical protein
VTIIWRPFTGNLSLTDWPVALRAFFMRTLICAGILSLGLLLSSLPGTAEPGIPHGQQRLPTAL